MRSFTTRRLKKSAKIKKEDFIYTKTGQYRANLISRIEFMSSVSYKFLPHTHTHTHTLSLSLSLSFSLSLSLCSSLLLAYTMTLATSVTVHVIAQKQILRMSNHSELRVLRSEGIQFKNKYEFLILKSTMMPKIKEAFVESQRKYKICIILSLRVLFWCLFYRHNIFKKLVSRICA